MVLGSPGRAGPHPGVGGAVDSVRQDALLEVGVVGHHGGREVVLHALAGLEHQVLLAGLVLGHHLRPGRGDTAGKGQPPSDVRSKCRKLTACCCCCCCVCVCDRVCVCER